MVIEWSDEDQTYIVSFPEWWDAGTIAHIDGASYEEAAAKAHDLLNFLIESVQEEGEQLPTPRLFSYPGAGTTSQSDSSASGAGA
jgi:predicted RNase H-like HicB family nuclease